MSLLQETERCIARNTRFWRAIARSAMMCWTKKRRINVDPIYPKNAPNRWRISRSQEKRREEKRTGGFFSGREQKHDRSWFFKGKTRTWRIVLLRDHQEHWKHQLIGLANRSTSNLSNQTWVSKSEKLKKEGLILIQAKVLRTWTGIGDSSSNRLSGRSPCDLNLFSA